MDTSKIRIIIGGLARNCGKYLPSCFTWLLEVRNYFHLDSKIVLITNDSTDNTTVLLSDFTETYRSFTKLYVCDGLSVKKPQRTDRLAFCRNMILTYMRQHCAGYDYMILADLDNVTASFDPKRILTCFNPSLAPSHWDVLTAISLPTYYDIWALRSSTLGLTVDCWDHVRHEMRNGVNYDLAVEKCVQRWNKDYKPTDSPIEVESAFGGLAIYRISATTDCNYVGLTMECSLGKPSPWCLREICEHVPFHKQMRERHGARIWIFPPLYITPTE